MGEVTYIFVHGTNVRQKGFNSTASSLERLLFSSRDDFKTGNVISVPWFLNYSVSTSQLKSILPEVYSYRRFNDDTDILRDLSKKYDLNLKELSPELSELLYIIIKDPSYMIREYLIDNTFSNNITCSESTAIEFLQNFEISDLSFVNLLYIRSILSIQNSNINEVKFLVEMYIIAEGYKSRMTSYQDSPKSFTKKLLKDTTLKLLTRILFFYRASATKASAKFLGDIFYYKTHKDRLINNLTLLFQNTETPIVLIGHSLGGIICADAIAKIATDNKSILDKIKLIVTAGTQISLLYKTNSMEYLRKESSQLWPKSIPWINGYDPSDFLSFRHDSLMEELGVINKIEFELNTKFSFPDSHSSYWLTESEKGSNDFFERIKSYLTSISWRNDVKK
ncbi:hypothetical protein [Deinococcus cellulosilyticus]|uniref:Uncharacterized protein n=1 Tax=Deinococcus cellulosilyticus (strain DSM 18568 / NBRC 106333 / KACC 11606 / 5516J-15) TaxID=1223518 RepID=A0A511N6F6_DEIC1|nr:hypothetical protein [Deinococcus cellulosilyticus]GEM48440.1 hypothetical protein DC3_40750 [Deinococcus cellulosilyticus NBRC 106333 = KACC 11606]